MEEDRVKEDRVREDRWTFVSNGVLGDPHSAVRSINASNEVAKPIGDHCRGAEREA